MLTREYNCLLTKEISNLSGESALYLIRMMHDELGSLGIAGEKNFLQLYYDNYSNTLIVHFYGAIGLVYGLKSLWTRLASEKIYNRLSSMGEQLSYEDPALSPSCLHLYQNSLGVQSKDGQYNGHEWQSIEGIDLTRASRKQSP